LRLGEIGGKVLAELRGVEVIEAVRCLLDRRGSGKVTREALSGGGFAFSGIRHVGRDIHEPGH
jgi:hypothetical protein